MTGIITGLNDWGCQGAECFSKSWPPLYRYCYFYWLIDFTSDVKTLPSASFNSFTRTMGLMGLIEALRLKKRSKKWRQQALLLIDRFPGKVRPKNKCLPSYPITQNPSSYEQQHSTKVYSLIKVPFILLFMNRAWIRIHQRLIQLFSRRMSFTSLLFKKESKIKMTKTIEWYEDAFLEFHPTAGKRAVSASTFPLFKDLKKNYHLKSMINKISDVQPSLSVSPWVLIYIWRTLPKWGWRKEIYQ